MKLTEIQVQEISLVDKAANKRVFAFLKKDEKVEESKEAGKEGATDAKETVATVNGATSTTVTVVATKETPSVQSQTVETKIEEVVPKDIELDAEDVKILQAIQAACTELASNL